MAAKEVKKRPSADATRESIVREASKLFVKQGFAATSISEIAGKAKINQSLIYHHFGSKEGLWVYIKSTSFETYASKQGVQLEEYEKNIKTAKEFITTLFNFRFDMYDKHPEFARMLTWQRMEPSSSKLTGVRHESVEVMVKIIKKFQKQGEITKQYDAEDILFMLFAHSFIWFGDLQTVMHNLSAKQRKEKKAAFRKILLETALKSYLT